MEREKKLVIVGTGEFGDIAYEYFSFDSDYTVCGFAVEKQYRDCSEKKGLPVIDLESVVSCFPPNECDIFVAVTYVKLNRERARLFEKCKEMGYHCASYVSSRAFVWHNVSLGENVFIFENNTIQHRVSIGDNVILWSGNHVGHQTIIEDNCWITSHCVISGFCHIGRNTFMGVNATLGDNVELGTDSVFAAASVTVKSLTDIGKVYIGSPAKSINRTAYEQFGVID